MLRRLIGEDIEVELRSAERPARGARRRRADRAGRHQPRRQRARRDARRRHAADRDPRRRRLRLPRGHRHRRRDRARRAPARLRAVLHDQAGRATGPGSGWPRCTARSRSRAGTCGVDSEPRPRARRSRSSCRPPPSSGAAGAGRPATDDRLGGDETILLCEDEDGVRALVELVLSGAGYRVLGEARPSDALERAPASRAHRRARDRRDHARHAGPGARAPARQARGPACGRCSSRATPPTPSASRGSLPAGERLPREAVRPRDAAAHPARAARST